MECIAFSAGRRKLAALTDDTEVGKAAEHLVCVDLITKNYRTMMSGQGLPYDVIVDLGKDIVRVQVKATRKAAKRGGYRFRCVRRNRPGRGRSRVSHKDCDIIACVALDIGRISYFAVHELTTTSIYTHTVGVHSFESALRDHRQHCNPH